MTAPVTGPVASAPELGVATSVLRTAAVEHLGNTEALLTLVRADSRGGSLDPKRYGVARHHDGEQ